MGPDTYNAEQLTKGAVTASTVTLLTVAAQRLYGLTPVDGMCGPETIHALQSRQGTTPPVTEFVDGWYNAAKRKDVYVGKDGSRIGGFLAPKAVVFHQTDTAPGGYDAMVRSWTTELGRNASVHFLVGRGPEDGVTQFIPITRCAYHAGEAGHGWIKTPSGGLMHPNTTMIGIEVDNAGLLTGSPGHWVHPDSGHKIADADVYTDDRNRGWHKMTDYQKVTMTKLIKDLGQAGVQLPEGCTVQIDQTHGNWKANGVAWAELTPIPGYVVGHVTLDPYNKNDPGPAGIEWIKEWANG